MKTNRKAFLKTSALLGLGAMTIGVKGNELDAGNNNQQMDTQPTNGKFELPPLGYAYNSLEPFIDATTMEIHYSKHHQTYVSKLNEALAKEPSLANKSLEELFIEPISTAEHCKIRSSQPWRRTLESQFFLKSLKAGTQMGPKFKGLATSSFGGVETLQSTFDKIALGVFGSGWAWLILQNGQLKIKTSANQDNPLMDAAQVPEMMPKIILGVDLWEHAYYLKHQNRRAEYLKSFWNVVNWDEIEQLLP